MENNQPPLVAIRCYTYNHKDYILDALRGFTMQRTNFQYITIVVDDASPDNTSSVIDTYVKSNFTYDSSDTHCRWEDEASVYTFARHKTNENCYILFLALKKNLNDKPEKPKLYNSWMENAKYIALCEGDDYWTDPLKLQKQVDFLEEHEGYGLICSQSEVFDQVLGTKKGIQGNPSDAIFENLFRGSSDLYTATVMMHINLYNQYLSERKFLELYDLHIDTAMYYWFAINSKIYYMEEPTAVYRVLRNSACHSDDSRKTLKMMQRYLDVKIAFLSYCKNISTERFAFMMHEIRDYEQQVIDYAQYIKELEVRNSKTYKLGKFLLKPFRKK